MVWSKQCSVSFAENLGRYDLSGAGCGNSASPVLRRGQSKRFDCSTQPLPQLLIRIKDFVLEPPPGYLEYQKAIISKDEHFNYMENEYFKRHILPYMIKGHNVNQSDHTSIDQQQLLNNHSQDTFRVNPVTGLPMIGSYDAGGSPFGFNYNHSIHHQINYHSSFSNMHTSNQFNSFDYWNR